VASEHPPVGVPDTLHDAAGAASRATGRTTSTPLRDARHPRCPSLEPGLHPDRYRCPWVGDATDHEDAFG